MTYCYLIHFSKPIGNTSNRHSAAQHYLGYTTRRVLDRLTEHVQGRGAKITRAASLSGAALTLVRTWRPGTRGLERSLKNQKRHSKFCPICSPKLRKGRRFRSLTLANLDQRGS